MLCRAPPLLVISLVPWVMKHSTKSPNTFSPVSAPREFYAYRKTNIVQHACNARKPIKPYTHVRMDYILMATDIQPASKRGQRSSMCVQDASKKNNIHQHAWKWEVPKAMHVHMYVEIIGKLKKKSACNWLTCLVDLHQSGRAECRATEIWLFWNPHDGNSQFRLVFREGRSYENRLAATLLYTVNSWIRWSANSPVTVEPMISQWSSYVIANDYWMARINNDKIMLLPLHCRCW